MINKKLIFIYLFFCAWLAQPVYADTHIWNGEGSDNLFSNSDNWDINAVPIDGDAIVFDGTTGTSPDKDCTWDSTNNFSGTSVDIQSGYSGTITVPDTKKFDFEGGSVTFDGGTLDINITGGALVGRITNFDASGSGTKTLNLGAGQYWFGYGSSAATAIDFSGVNLTLNVETSDIRLWDFSNSMTFTPKSGTKFYKLGHWGSNRTVTLGADVYVTNTLEISGNSASSKTWNGYKLYAEGNVIMDRTNTNVLGTTILEFSGSAAQDYTNNISSDSNAVKLDTIINKSGGAVTLTGTHRINADWTHTAGTLTAGTSIVNIAGTGTSDFDMDGASFYDLAVKVGTLQLSSNADVDNDFEIDTSDTFTPGAYTHTVGGNFTNNGTFTKGTSTVLLDGASDQTIDGSTNFYSLTLKGAGAKIFDDADSWTIDASGTFTANGTADAQIIIKTDLPGTQADLDLTAGATMDIDNATVTDIDSSGGQAVTGTNLTLSNTLNWSESTGAGPLLIAPLNGGLHS